MLRLVVWKLIPVPINLSRKMIIRHLSAHSGRLMFLTCILEVSCMKLAQGNDGFTDVFGRFCPLSIVRRKLP
jgi:hypothetical protein